VTSGTSIDGVRGYLSLVINTALAFAGLKKRGETTMTSLGFEDWLIGVASAVAVVGTFAVHALSSPVSVAYATEAEAPAAYTITVTGHRKPAQCKTDPSAAMCAERDATMTMRAN
jgi:hypothetical protein